MNERLRQMLRPVHPALATAGRWLIFFLGLLGSIWLATSSRMAPQLILLTLLSVIAINFSVPLVRGIISPVLPVVAVSSLLVVGIAPTLVVFGTAFLLAELARPLWLPLWQSTPLATVTWTQRLGRALSHLLILAIVTTLYRQFGGSLDLAQGLTLVTGEALNRLILLSFLYGLVYLLVMSVFWGFWHAALLDYLGKGAVYLLSSALLAQPFALFGALTFINIGLPGFVIFCAGAGGFAIVSWLSWQRHFALERQLDQFAALNAVGISLRETLDLPAVLQRTYQQVSALIPADYFFIALQDDSGRWQQLIRVRDGEIHSEPVPFTPDDFSQWVAREGRVLDLNPENMHFAARHDLEPPQPQPASWLGVPLKTASETIGVMVLQRFATGETFSRWSREILLAIAGQASAAIQNARLYSEVVRLYNRTDEALAGRVKQLQALLNSTNEGVLMVNTTGEIVLVNPPAATLLGRPQTTLQGTVLPTTAAANLGYESETLTQRLRALRSGQSPPEQRTVYIQRNHQGTREAGARRFIERNEAAVVGDDDQLLGWLMVLHDVTEEQERAEWRTNVTHMIVHDLRNPVTTLASQIEMMESALAEGATADARTQVQKARYGCDDMLDMIDSLMDMTRLEAGQMVVEAEAMRLPPLAVALFDRLQPLAQQKEIELILEHAPDLPPVWADADIIRRVFVNLLDNALKFAPAATRVTVTLTPEQAPDGYETGVRCIVSDRGPGVPAAYRERIFERFTRVNVGGGQVRGTGLGLSFCKLAIEAHGGQIWVENEPEGGSSFIFTLPGIPLFF